MAWSIKGKEMHMLLMKCSEHGKLMAGGRYTIHKHPSTEQANLQSTAESKMVRVGQNK